MPAHPTSVDLLRRSIALDLAQFRIAAGYLKQSDAAKAGKINASRLSQVEGKHRLPSDEFAKDLLAFYKVPAETRTDFLDRLAAAREPAERPDTTKQDPREFDIYGGYERAATRISAWNPLIPHGLVQDRDFVAALIANHSQPTSKAERTLSPIESQRRLEARVKRQEILVGESPTHLDLVVTEYALEVPIGGPDVAHNNRLALVHKLKTMPHFNLWTIPKHVPPYPGLHGAFTMMEFPLEGDPGVVYTEDLDHGRFVEEPAVIADYQRRFQELQRLAAPDAKAAREQSIRIISSIRKENM